jgi:hypothetical protein
MNFEVVVISEPYHFYEKSEQTRIVLSKIFSNQLTGYKEYYPEGVCPISEYDFFTNHIAIRDRQTKEILCSYKVMEYKTCIKYKKQFPLFAVLGEEHPESTQAIRKWMQGKDAIGYNHSWTINPDLSKEVKKELNDITFATLALFYMENKITNIIDISIVPFRIHEIKEWMGNSYLKNVPSFPVKEYGGLKGCIMVNEGLVFTDEFKLVIDKYKFLWNAKVKLNKNNYMEISNTDKAA